MAKFNGYKSWTQWNVSLWLNNDEGLYLEMKMYARRYDREKAARLMLESLTECGITETPDGAKYSKTAIMAAMVGL